MAVAGVRSQIGWMLRGQSRTVGALDVLSNDLRELQQKVAAIETAIGDIHRGQRELSNRQLDEFDRVRAAVAAATDDLTARVASLQDEVRSQP